MGLRNIVVEAKRFEASELQMIRQDSPGLSQRDMVIVVLAIAFMESAHLAQRKGSVRAMVNRRPVWVRWAAYYALIAGIVFLGAFNQSQQFIYFQF